MEKFNYQKIKREESLRKYTNLAKSKNGKFLPKEYIGINQKYLWECDQGHRWYALPINVGKGKWCPTCAGNTKCSLEDCQNLAFIKNGKCLSIEYRNAATPMLWECFAGHQWQATFNNIKSKNSWCPYCLYSGEKITKAYLEHLLGVTFDKVKPDWLKNDEGNNLELDGFNEELNVAFEFQGMQHYKTSFFTKTQEALDKRKRDDLAKIVICKDKKIKLLIINQPKILDVKELEIQIQNLLIHHQIPFKNIKMNYSKYFLSNKIVDLQKIALDKKGKCLSSCYFASDVKLTWQCQFGHEWKAIPYLIEKGHWCKRCATAKNSNK